MSAVTALIVVDLQQATMPNAKAFEDVDWLDHAASLVDSFHERDLPVVIATATGTPPGRTTYSSGGSAWPAEASVVVPQIARTDDDLVVSRRALSAFAGTGLADRLRDLGVTDVAIVGIAASYGVESTARDAYDLGFHVVVVSDAIADLQRESLQHALTSVFPVIGRVATTTDVEGGLPGR